MPIFGISDVKKEDVMKHTMTRCAAFLLSLLLLPFLSALGHTRPANAVLLFPEDAQTFPPYFSSVSYLNNKETLSCADSEKSPALCLPEHYQVLDVKTGEILLLTPAEYLLGVTAAEMPASGELEALKAQAAAAHTYALYQMGLQLKNPDPALKGAAL